MHWMIEPLRRYADFSGRARRTEFWMFILFQWLVNGAIAIVFFGLAGSVGALEQAGGGGSASTAGAIGVVVVVVLFILFWLAMLIPNLAVAARRCQDQDIPGVVGILLVLSGFLFTFPFLIMTVFGFIEGTRGPNRFGNDPKGDHIADTFA